MRDLKPNQHLINKGLLYVSALSTFGIIHSKINIVNPMVSFTDVREMSSSFWFISYKKRSLEPKYSEKE